jgi:hypothetical protein
MTAVQYPTKPSRFRRTTHRCTRIVCDDVLGFQACRGTPLLFKWRLNAKLIERHLDKDNHFNPNELLLVSVHASVGRNARYTLSQKQILVNDLPYEDPDLWIYEISTDSLQWETITIPRAGDSIRMMVLRDHKSKALFFSTTEAQKCFGINSRWMTVDEWFAVAQIPATLIQRKFQIVDGFLPSGMPYKLIPVPPELVPDDLVPLPSLDIFSLVFERRICDRKQDDQMMGDVHQEAMRREYEDEELDGRIHQEEC